MKTCECGDICFAVCDFCVHASFNASPDEEALVGSCYLHGKVVESTDTCDSFRCFFAVKNNDA